MQVRLFIFYNTSLSFMYKVRLHCYQVHFKTNSWLMNHESTLEVERDICSSGSRFISLNDFHGPKWNSKWKSRNSLTAFGNVAWHPAFNFLMHYNILSLSLIRNPILKQYSLYNLYRDGPLNSNFSCNISIK